VSPVAAVSHSSGTRLDAAALDQLLLEARTHNKWSDRPVDNDTLHEIYQLARMGPTSANSQPMRLVFVTSPAAKERLRPALAAANVDKTMSAPVTVIVAHDLAFYDHLPELMPQMDARSLFAALPAEQIERIAFQGSSMQGAYVILAARALGLDCGPLGGFDRNIVDAAFFPDGRWQSNFLLNLGYGDPAGVRPRNPRLSFETACRIV
jgi:3-hydroxypropanoate dehydrogenase